MKKYIIPVFALFMLLTVLSCRDNSKEKEYAKMDKELADLCRKIDKNPKDPELYYLRSDYYFAHNKIEKAFDDIYTSIKLDSTKAKYYIKLSDLYFSQRETDLTEEMLEKAVLLEPKNNEAHLKLAELYFLLKMYDRADEELDKALEIQSHNPKAHLIRAFTLKEYKRDTVGAIRMLQLVIDQDPREIKAFLELGYIYQQKGDPIAISYYQNALNIDPKNVEINYNLAMLYQELGDYEKAKEQYRILLTIDPNNKYALHNMGYIYSNFEEKYEEAVSFYTQALKVDSLYLEAVYDRGFAFEEMKQYDNARQDYLYVRKLSENYEPAIEGLNRLDKIRK